MTAGRAAFWPTRLASIVLGLAVCFGIEAFCHHSLTDYGQRMVVLVGLYVTLAVSLNLINGITGQFSIGHAAFYQIGAYLTGYISIHYFAHYSGAIGSIPWLIGMTFLGAAFAALAGLVVGLPSLRLKGDYLAIVTLGFGEIVRIVIQNQESIGGSYGLKDIPGIKSIALIWILAFICIAVCRNLLKTARGLTFIAVREDEVASSAMGVDVTKVKVTAFMVGAAFAGAAGVLFAHYEQFISPQNFTMDVSFIILTMVVLGGTGSITGSVFAAAFLSYLPEYLRTLKAADGGTLHVFGPTILGSTIAVFVAVGGIRWVTNKFHGGVPGRVGLYAASIAGGIVAEKILALLLNRIGPIADIQVEAEQLRMAIFAVSLIAIMLIRPQGIFAHHEFSWDWLLGLFGKRRVPTSAVSS